jgi:AAA15 family ATPase/GTPase
MRLIGFRVQNIKSIKDSGWCHLSGTDNINVFAGQNEAGKSAILEALNFFRNGPNEQFERLSKRMDDTHPYVECEFQFEEDDFQGNDNVLAVIKNIHAVRIQRGDTQKSDYASKRLNPETEKIITDEVKKLVAQSKNIAQQVEKASDEGIDESTKNVETVLDAESLIVEIRQHITNHLPEFIYYDSFASVLPGTVKLADMDNYPAIKDLQKVFNINFSELISKDARARASALGALNNQATVDLNTYWKQRHTTEEDDTYAYSINVHPDITNKENSVVEFMIHRNDGVPLFIEQKSKGFQWFSAFNLRLKALGVDVEKSKRYIILIDEPGQGLHETAQADVKSVLEELASKGMQILYTTHNANLIGVMDSELLRIRLVSQTRNGGTIVKNIAQFSSSEGSADALSPVITAMGISNIGQLLDRKVPAVALEGITDHYYMNAASILLNISETYSFIPSIGVNNIKPLISVLVGWGANYRAIFDDGAGRRIHTDISRYLYPEDDVERDKHILKLDGFNGIEDLFSKEDFDKYILLEDRKDYSLSNSEYIKSTSKKKELLARLFLEKVRFDKESIVLSEETKKNFEKIFEWLRSS